MPSPISHDADTNGFTLRLKNCAYFIAVLSGGEVVNGGFAPLPPDAPPHPAIVGLGDYGDANYVWDRQAAAYEYPAYGDVTYHESAFKAAFPQPPAPLAPGEAAHLPVRDVRFRYHGHEIRTDAVPLGSPVHGLPTQARTPRETLCLRLKDAAYDFHATLFYRLTPEHDIIERWVEIDNRTDAPVEIETADFGVLNLPAVRTKSSTPPERGRGSSSRSHTRSRRGLSRSTNAR